jgi:DNA-binding YbaB/EbfC family protein
MKGFMDMMKKAQELQGRMQEMQERLAAMEVEGVSGAGMVKITLDGKGAMKGLSIDSGIVKPDETEILEDLIIAAHNDAAARLEKEKAEKMQELTGDLPIPQGLKLF